MMKDKSGSDVTIHPISIEQTDLDSRFWLCWGNNTSISLRDKVLPMEIRVRVRVLVVGFSTIMVHTIFSLNIYQKWES